MVVSINRPDVYVCVCDSNMRFPADIMTHIFTFDQTFHEVFQGKVLPELRRAHTEFMAEIFFYFFWDARYIRSVTYGETRFHFTTMDHQKYTIEYMNDDHVMITFRVHNHRTGMWYDRVL